MKVKCLKNNESHNHGIVVGKQLHARKYSVKFHKCLSLDISFSSFSSFQVVALKKRRSTTVRSNDEKVSQEISRVVSSENNKKPSKRKDKV